MDIRPVDGSDEAAFRAQHEVYRLSQEHERPFATPWLADEVLPELRAPTRRRRLLAYAGSVDGQVVCAGSLVLPLLDNLGGALLGVDTLPGHRGRGHGSAMLAHLEAVAAGEGRTRLGAEAFYPYDAAVDGAGHAYADFLTRRGYRFGLGDVQRVLDLPVDPVVLDRLAGDAAAHHAAYRVVGFASPVPEEHLAGYLALEAAVATEAPTGDLDLESEAVDPVAFREREALLGTQGRRTWTALAFGPDGEAAAYTDLSCSRHDPATVFQWGTLVRRADRGHRLGTAVKVANLRQVQRAHPEVRRVVTWNAEVNAPMVAVNDALGFRPVARLGEFQKRL